jgi:hypothetical protein
MSNDRHNLTVDTCDVLPVAVWCLEGGPGYLQPLVEHCYLV